MRIIGFAQTMRLDGSEAKEGYEIKLLLDSGLETSVPTSQDTIMALTKLWAATRKTTARIQGYGTYKEPSADLPAPPIGDQEDEETSVFGGGTPDLGETTGGNSIAEVVADEMGYPVPVVKNNEPRPKFLEADDEDGHQV
jgi:hypothetical protein